MNTPFEIHPNKLIELTKKFCYKNNGDYFEREFNGMVLDLFANSELFWRDLVTPITKRLDDKYSNKPESLEPRKHVDSRIKDISALHYSVYLNLVYAAECFNKRHISFFENFYAHLGTVCDLAEEFITELYFVILECIEKETEILQRLSKTKFLKIASEWYDQNYSNAYSHYLTKGKTPPIKLISRPNILDEYFGVYPSWKQYKTFALGIRTYRNVVVHYSQIPALIVNNQIFVPKRARIHNYKKWHQAANVEENRFRKDFIGKDLQMEEDFKLIKKQLNDIWQKPYNDFHNLLYVQKNAKLLEKYNLNFSE